MGLRVTPAQYAEKWGKNLNAAGPYISQGVDRVKVAPGESAAAAQDLMLQRLTEAVTSGLWAKRVSAVSLSDWQNAMKTKGINRIAAGVAQAQKTKLPMWTALLSAVETAQAAAQALPKGNIEQSIARAAAFMRSMQSNAPRKTGG